MLITGMAVKREPKEFICHCIKAWLGRWATHIEAVYLMGDNSNSMKCILDAFKIDCKCRSNEIVAATAYKHLVQGYLGLPEYMQKCKEVTRVCHFSAAYDKCL